MVVILSMKGPLIIFVVGSILSTSGADIVKKCRGENGVLKYKIGESYSYNYGVHAFGHYEFDRRSGESNKPVVHINGSAILTAVSECEYVLTMKDIVISSRPTDTDGKETETSKIEIEQSSLKFTMSNAVIQDIFFSANDPSWLVNMKKSVLFMIQNRGLATVEKDNEHESSVFGHCLTEYTNTGKSYVKFTHLRKCGQGEGSDLIFRGVPYQIPLVTNKPIFGFLRPDGHVRCSQTVENGILNNVICSEGNTLVSVLKFSQKSSSIVNDEEFAKLVVPTSVLFNFTKSYSKLMEENAVEKIKQLLKALKQDGSNKAETFIDLKTAAARVSNLEQFTTSEYITEDIHKKTFYDALAEVTTDEAVKVVANAATKGQLDNTTLLNFYTNIAFATAPGLKSLKSLSELIKVMKIKNPDVGNESDLKKLEDFNANISLGQHLLLGASGLAYQYCKLTNAQCILVSEYQILVDSIAGHVNVQTENEDIVLGALHGLGNLDALTPKAVEAIQNLLIESTTPLWMQIQAMDGFRRDPCQPTLKETVRKIMADSSKTDQVRIHAYLALSKCITPDDMATLQDIMKQANSAVGGFIGSHIRNLRDSSSPSKAYLKSMLAKISLPESIMAVHNKSRACKYVEHSHFNPKENLGISGETTIIFIPGQAKPEFVSFNATVDLYGRSFNFLEVGLSQRFMMKPMVFQGDEVPAEWGGVLQAATSKDSYYRILGTTIGLGLDTIHEAIQSSISKTISGDTPGFIMDIIQPSSFLDEELIFPTICGLPLNFDVQAVHFDSIKLELLGASDVATLLTTSEGFNYKVTINADSASTIKGSIGLGAHTPVHTGYKMEGKLDHKQNLGIAISSKDGPKLDMDLKFNFPNQIISSRDLSVDIYGFEEIQGNFAKLRNNGKEAMIGESLISQPRHCWNFYGLLGLNECHSLRNGGDFPKLFRCTLEKENPEMQGFDIKITSSDASTPTYDMTITTPGSTTFRRLKLSTIFNKGNEISPEYWEAKDLTATLELDDSKYYGHVLLNRTEVVQFPVMIPHDYDLTVDYSDSSAKKPAEILKFATRQPKERALNVMAKFKGPLSNLGDLNYNHGREYVKHPQHRYYLSSKDFKHFDWASEVLGNIVGDFSDEYSQTTGSKVLANISHNNRIYMAQHTYDVTSVLGEEISTDEEGRNYTYKSTIEYLEKLRTLIIYHPKKQYEIETDIGYQKLSEYQYKRNLSMNVKTPHHDGPILAKVVYVKDNNAGDHTGSLSIETEGQKQIDVSAKSNHASGFHEIKGEMKNEGQFFANFSDNGVNRHFHMDINCTNREITVDSDYNDDGNELKQKTEVSVNDRQHKIVVKSETSLVMDRSKRTLDYLSSTVDDKYKVLSKVEMNAQLAQDYLNGKSTANMRFTNQNGRIYIGSVNQTVASTEGKFLQSNLAMDFHQPNTVPLTYNWDLMVDSSRSGGDVYDTDVHITSDKHFTGVYLSPFDILIQKDIHFQKKKGQNQFELMSSSNITDKGKLERTSEMKVTVSGHDEKWNSITVRTNGYTESGNFRDTFTGQLDSENETPEKLGGTMTQKLIFNVDRTDLAKKVTRNLIEGSLNKTGYFHDIYDFQMTEAGQVRIEKEKTIKWIQLVRFNNHELTIFKEVEEMNGKDVRDTKFLFDVSAKVVDQNHQTKFIMRSRHSHIPDCPVSNVNFTLSK